MKLLLKIKYNGAPYCGFQYQPDAPTVQGTLTEKISEALGFPVTVTGCSRTDAGVHALGYVAAVAPRETEKQDTEWCTVPSSKLHRVINQCLPESIAVIGACRVDDAFHPRYDAVGKEYIYLIDDSVTADPFGVGRSYHVKKKLSDADIGKMNEAAEKLLGKHDFSAFMASGSSVTDTVRTLTTLHVERDGAYVKVTAAADGFLYNMVRILTGTLLGAAAGSIDVNDIPKILASGDRSASGATAPAHGLYLNRVFYAEEPVFEAD
ncbi:MAG: tRNA pseudouridine(38-40) synthase TruA [Clostridia bacterium]|nr:tRNA pseudouridine(38-40) synthase TruA [Clostridia bacterium]